MSNRPSKFAGRNRYHHLYGARWRKARAEFLAEHPLCKFHLARDKYVAANVVDHRKPHEGNEKLFWDRSNWQSLCGPCHNSHKQRQEKSGHVIGCDTNGIPIDPTHHWNQ